MASNKNIGNGRGNGHKTLKWTLAGLGVITLGLMAFTKMIEDYLGPAPLGDMPQLSLTEAKETSELTNEILGRPNAPYVLKAVLDALPVDDDFASMTIGASRRLKDDCGVINDDDARSRWLVDHAWDICALAVVLEHHRSRYLKSVGLTNGIRSTSILQDLLLDPRF